MHIHNLSLGVSPSALGYLYIRYLVVRPYCNGYNAFVDLALASGLNRTFPQGACLITKGIPCRRRLDGIAYFNYIFHSLSTILIARRTFPAACAIIPSVKF